MGINRTSGLKRLGILAAALGLLSLANPAVAQIITYVATNGNDANPCTVITAPCKTLQRAVNVTSANGTVRVLTPLVSSVFINKSITIEGVRPTIVGQITIGGATAVVTLRGLALDGVGGYVNGIRIDSAAKVHIEDCSVERYTGTGINLVATTATQLFVSDTVSRDNSSSGLHADDVNARAQIENSRFEGNVDYGLYLKVAKANVVRSAASENNHGVYQSGGTANVTETTAANNGNNGFQLAGGGATLAFSVVRGNDLGLVVEPGASLTVTDTVITSNVSYAVVNSGALYTRQNNTVGGAPSAPLPFRLGRIEALAGTGRVPTGVCVKEGCQGRRQRGHRQRAAASGNTQRGKIMGINRAFGLKRLGILAAALSSLSLATPAAAQYITYVAANGNDGNPCTVITAPCKTLQRAVNVTPANGAVRVLTPLTSSVFINKNVTISGDGVPIVGQITIGGATAVVTLRGLALNGVGAYVNGIRIDNAVAVHIEDTTVERYIGDGIKIVTTAATKLFIRNTISRDNVGGADGLYADADNAKVEIVNSHFDRNGSSGVYLEVGWATITGGSASGNASNGIIIPVGAASITISGTAADDNGQVGFEIRNNQLALLNSATARGNGSYGLVVTTNANAVINRCVFRGGGTGTGLNNQGNLFSGGNNLITSRTGNALGSFVEE